MGAGKRDLVVGFLVLSLAMLGGLCMIAATAIPFVGAVKARSEG